jgi:Family of unknown function (DUF5681)
MTAPKTKSAPCKVGYGNPPRHTRFRKGQSGNPRGRPPRPRAHRVKALTLKEAYRGVAIIENGRAEPVTAIQAILRSQVELAVKGNVQAQRAVLAAVRALEKEEEMAATPAAIRLSVYVHESGTVTCEREPDGAERGVKESNAAPATGGEALSTSPDLRAKLPVPGRKFPVPHGTGNSA